ncbi:ATP-binding protein [Sphingomonas sp. ASV193]|uniref:ATP-binding protein n=1 Tax=Sphingomonas sp. ASV193 TaxID=3144405 RepID=UPI0032E84F47
MRRLILGSIEGRMIVLSALATLVALLVAGWVIGGILEKFVVQGLDRRLDGEVALLASTVGPDGRVDLPALRQKLGALDEAPGWQWQIAGPHGSVGSSDFPRLDRLPRPRPPHGDDRRAAPPPPPPPPIESSPISALDGHAYDRSEVHARQLVIPARDGPVTITAVAPRSLIDRPLAAAVAPLLAVLAALAVLLVTATIVQLRLGLRPLRRLRADVAAIRRGARESIAPDQPTELAPLASELDALAADNRSALAAARLSSANLAHALKTPVAKLAIDVRDRPDLAAQVERIDRSIRHHLARARSEIANRRSASELAPLVDDLVATIGRIHHDRGLGIAAAVDDGLSVAVDPDDVTELVGNILDNAARHARRRVEVTASPAPDDPRTATIRIDDDGPGIASADVERAIRGGTRLDERGDGYGFGLSIASELVALYGGSLALATSPLGGLGVTIRLPRVVSRS